MEKVILEQNLYWQGKTQNYVKREKLTELINYFRNFTLINIILFHDVSF